MTMVVFRQMKQFLGFSRQDAANLRELAQHAGPVLPDIADSFYRAVDGHEAIRAILSGEGAMARDLRETMLGWLEGLFCGCYDRDYCRRRATIGRAHVRANVPQHFMVAGMQLIWDELSAHLRNLNLPNVEDRLFSLHKLLTIEVGMMVESYKQTYATNVRHLERDAMRARLNEAEQLAQIGQLAASLAHEIKNPLAGISGAIQVMRDSLTASDEHFPVLTEVLRQIKRLDRTVKDLLVYARPKPARFQPCDFHHVVNRVVTLLHEEPAFGRVRFEHIERDELPVIDADEHQLEQLLVNLLLNAAQASCDGGLVRLISSALPRGLRVVVEDRGAGMTPDVYRRALEPFYTTKSRGTGLGLPICHKIVEAHHGKLNIRTSPEDGTTVTVDLPETSPAAATQRRRRPADDSWGEPPQ